VTIDPAVWSASVFGQANLGDARRTKRLVALGRTLAESTGASLPLSCGTDSALQEGLYRFARNEKVSAEAILAAGFQATKKHLGKGTILAVDDSTTLSYHHDVVNELGDIGGQDRRSQGMWVHSSLLIDEATRSTLGLADQQIWIRDPEEYGMAKDRRKRAFKDKESFKWVQCSKNLRRLLGPEVMPRVVEVADREAHVYPHLADKLAHGERFVIRGTGHRLLDDAGATLITEMVATPRRGRVEVQIPQKGGRPARKAVLALYATPYDLKRPKTAEKTLPDTLRVNILLAQESTPPSHVEEPLEWLLLTTEPIETAGDLERILDWYRERWRIEVFHKAWKTGAGVERLRMQTADNLKRMAVVMAFVAVRLLQLREMFEQREDVPCSHILDEQTWKLLWISTEKTRPPRRPPTGKWAYQALGRLAGWGDTKQTGRVGWETLWNGWLILHERLAAFEAYRMLSS
jgi:hypothetical protein